jgi:predicted DNA binding CopG/RHH family protein
MATKKLVIPAFATAQAEAAWFDRNRSRLETDLLRRLRAGETVSLSEALKRSAAKERSQLKPVTIRMPATDLAALRRLAQQKGLPYQTYMKMLLREALHRAGARRSKVHP